MNGKLIARLVEAALVGKQEQVKIIANLLSNDIRSSDPETSKLLAKLVASPLRSIPERVNPHLISKNNNNGFILQSPKESTLLDELVLSDQNKDIINQVLNEHENISKLKKFNLDPTKTMLFKGPPGVGKTLTAKWIADKMKLPLKILDLASIMSSLLGKTGSNIKEVFEEASRTPCVLLLDEFDSVAKKRDDNQDIGELKRLVTVLLQCIDSWPSSSLLIAATNHAELLDRAIWRRFELKLNFDNPTDEQIKSFVSKITNDSKVSELSFIFHGMSYSDIRTEINNNKKISILKGIELHKQLLAAFTTGKANLEFDIEEKKKIAIKLISSGVSQRKTSELLNISRPTIKKALEEKI
ncbi:MAG: AAA family ATPase [Shewanella sp.]|nr:AAA family ATPase [Aeromonas dhakensis]